MTDLDSKEGRKKIRSEINDMAFLGPVGELLRNLKKNKDKLSEDQVNELSAKAEYLRDLVNRCLDRLDKSD